MEGVEHPSSFKNKFSLILINPRVNMARGVNGRTLHVENNLRCISVVKRGDVLKSDERLFAKTSKGEPGPRIQNIQV